MYAEFKERAELVHEDLEKKVELHIVFISEIN